MQKIVVSSLLKNQRGQVQYINEWQSGFNNDQAHVASTGVGVGAAEARNLQKNVSGVLVCANRVCTIVMIRASANLAGL